MDRVVNLPKQSSTGYSNRKDSPANIGAKIGAATGALAGVGSAYINRGLISQVGKDLAKQGLSKGMVRGSQALGVAFSVAILAGAAALVGAGIGKFISSLKTNTSKGVIPEDKKSPIVPPVLIKPKGVIPGENPKFAPVMDNDPFAKYKVQNPNALRTVTAKNGDEYYIADGHPKVVYTKNKETGELEYKSSVYDGSWGPEMSDKDLVESVIKYDKLKEKMQK